jgi:hypothetical protein
MNVGCCFEMLSEKIDLKSRIWQAAMFEKPNHILCSFLRHVVIVLCWLDILLVELHWNIFTRMTSSVSMWLVTWNFLFSFKHIDKDDEFSFDVVGHMAFFCYINIKNGHMDFFQFRIIVATWLIIVVVYFTDLGSLNTTSDGCNVAMPRDAPVRPLRSSWLICQVCDVLVFTWKLVCTYCIRFRSAVHVSFCKDINFPNCDNQYIKMTHMQPGANGSTCISKT